MEAASPKFPHEGEAIFQTLCEVMKLVFGVSGRLEALPGDLGETLENALASAFSDVCSALAHGDPDCLPFAIADLDLAAGCLEGIRIFGKIEDHVYVQIRERLVRAHDLAEALQGANLGALRACALARQDLPS